MFSFEHISHFFSIVEFEHVFASWENVKQNQCFRIHNWLNQSYVVVGSLEIFAWKY